MKELEQVFWQEEKPIMPAGRWNQWMDSTESVDESSTSEHLTGPTVVYYPKAIACRHGTPDEELVAERVHNAMLMLRDTIEIDPKKRGGTPVLKGTRFTFARLIGEIADGRNIVEISVDFELDQDVIKRLLEGLALFLDRPLNK